MINGIKPLPSVSDFDSALNRLLDNIHKDYQGWSSRIEYSSGVEKVDITIKTGRKFIKIIRDTSVWGFVAKEDGMHKGVPMKMGEKNKPVRNKPVRK